MKTVVSLKHFYTLIRQHCPVYPDRPDYIKVRQNQERYNRILRHLNERSNSENGTTSNS